MQLAAIFIHPIKSCAGIRLDHARVTPQGLEHDRRWMLVDPAGHFLSQRVHPEMALFRPRIEGDSIVVTHAQESLELPIINDIGERIEIEIWSHRGPAIRHDAGSDWFSRELGREVQLVCLPHSIARPIKPEYAKPGETVSFADEFPYLIASASSIADLSARVGSEVDIRRFRPNLVIAGAAPWAEDEWRRLRVGNIRFRLPKPCARCTIPGVDPDNGTIAKEPLRTLATFRKRDNEVYFGINAVAEDVGELRVGDPVIVED